MPKPLIHKMRTRSKKRAKQEREYLKLRKQFLIEHPICAMVACYDGSTDIHHKKGRVGDLLTDTKYFLQLCRRHHKDVEENPKWAKEHGYSLSRLAKEEV